MPDNNIETSDLTDPVVEDISKTPKPFPIPEAKPILSEQTPSETPPIPTPEPAPSVVSTPKPPKNLLIVPLVIVTLISVVTASSFYNKNKELTTIVQDLTNTLEAQETNITPEPTIEITPEPTLIPDPEATPTASPTIIQTKTETEQALAQAQSKYKDAQLILITSNNPHLEGQTTTKYWFRQSDNAKQYLYISFAGGEPALVDQQVYVSPDNNIPSLNQRLEEQKLGLSLKETLSFANSLCKDTEKCQQADSLKVQFLDTGSKLLWQVTYQVSDPAESIVFQIDSLTKEVVYQSQK